MVIRLLASAVFVMTLGALTPASSQALSCSDCTFVARQARAICEQSRGVRNPRDCDHVYADVLAQCLTICVRLP